MSKCSNFTTLKQKSDLSGVFGLRDPKNLARIREWSELSGVQLKRRFLP